MRSGYVQRVMIKMISFNRAQILAVLSRHVPQAQIKRVLGGKVHHGSGRVQSFGCSAGYAGK
jgi:hypothetical protein